MKTTDMKKPRFNANPSFDENMGFYEKLSAAQAASDSFLCVGLDPDPAKLPAVVAASPTAVFEFNRQIIDATIDLVCAYKPQIAYYSAYGREDELLQTIEYIHSLRGDIAVILDAKRGDIGATAAMYAREAFVRYGADAVTVNPYMGGESLLPFLQYGDKGVVVLCHTSNPGSADFQGLRVGGDGGGDGDDDGDSDDAREDDSAALFMRVAEYAAQVWNQNNNVCLVMGATFPERLAEVRRVVGDMPLLVPGVGAQGGDLEAICKFGLTAAGGGLMVAVSRAIIYAGAGDDFAAVARQEAQGIVHKMRRYKECYAG